MSFRLALAALLAPLAALPAIAQDTMSNNAATPAGTISHTGMSNGAMAAPGKSHDAMTGSAMTGGAMSSHSMSHGGTMAPASNSAPHA